VAAALVLVPSAPASAANLTLTTDRTEVLAETYATFTMTATVPGFYYIALYDHTNGTKVQAWQQGLTSGPMTVTTPMPSPPTPKTYIAYVTGSPTATDPPATVLQTSNTVAIHRPPYSVQLTVASSRVPGNQIGSFHAVTNQGIQPGMQIRLFRATGTQSEVQGCSWSGGVLTTCDVNVQMSGVTWTLFAAIVTQYDATFVPAHAVAVSPVMTIYSTGWPVWLRAVGDQLTARTGYPVQGTSFVLQIWDATARSLVATCSSGTSCTATAGAISHMYVAFVDTGSTSYPPSSVQGHSPVVWAPDDGPDGNANGAENNCGGCAGDPVYTATGELVESIPDLAVPGRGIALSLVRDYRSSRASMFGRLGYGWSDSYNMELMHEPTSFVGAAAPLSGAGTVTAQLENGSSVTFSRNGDGTYSAPARVLASLTHDADGTFTLHRRGGSSGVFDSAGRPIALLDRNGVVTALAYDSRGWLSSVTDSAGRALTFTYNATGTVAQISDSSGRTVSYTYSASNDLIGVTDPTGQHTTYGYDGTHNLTSITDARGHTTTTVFDVAGRVTSQTDRAARTLTFAYGSDSAVTITDPRQLVTVQQYDGSKMTSQTLGYGTADAATWTYTYDPVTLGVATVTDPLSHTWTYLYDSSGNRTSSCDPLSHCVTGTFNTYDEPLTVTDAASVTTTYTYDPAGNLLSSSAPVDATHAATTTLTYGDPAHPGDVTAVTDPRGKTTSNTYSSFGELASSTDPIGNQTTFDYTCTPAGPGCRSHVGWLYSSVSARGNTAGNTPAQYTTRYTRDDAGRALSVTDQLGNLTTYTYDGNGNTATATDANNHQTHFTYNNDDQLITTTRADATTVNTGYDPTGNVTSHTDGAAHTTAYGYDSLNRLSSVTDPNNRTTQYVYDAAGRLGSHTTADGAVTTRSYDNANRVTGLAYDDGTTPAVAYGYDADNRRTSMTDGTGTTNYSYNLAGWLTDVSDGAGHTVTYAHDLTGNTISIGYPGHAPVTRTFDDASRLTAVTDWNGHATTFGYDADSNLTTITYPNGVTEAVTLNRAGQTTAVTDSSASGTLATYSYGRDALGLLTATTPSGPTGQTNETYAHSALNQITSYTTATSNGNYSYDPADNLTGLPDASSQDYDPANQLTTGTGPTGTTTYTYNTRGDRSTATGTSGTTTYGYDAADRLTQMSLPTGTSASYTYNGDGLRTGKTVQAAASSFTWDTASSDLPLLLDDGRASYLYGPGGLPIEQILPPAPAISRVATGAALDSAGNASSLTVTFTAPAASDDQILLAVNENAGQNAAAPAGYTTVGTYPAPNAGETTVVYRRTATGGEAAVTVNFAANAVHAKTALAVIYRGVDPVHPIEAVSAAGTPTPTSTSITTPSLTTASADGQLVQIQHGLNNLLAATWSPPVGMTNRVQVGTNTVTSAVADQPVTSAGATGSRTASLSQPAQLEGVLLAMRRAPDTYYLQHDQQGSTRLITDPRGAIAGTYAYDPYGRTRAHTGITTALQYTGQQNDPESGLYYLRARYYDPATAQFLTRDPLEAMTGSPYGYVDGDPLDGSDPSGLFCLLGHSGSGCRGGGSYNWAVTYLDPISYALPYYAKEVDAYNSGCGLLQSLKYGGEGTAMLALGALGPEDGALARGAAKIGAHVAGKMGARGWTERAIQEAVRSGEQIPAINKATGNAATRYIHPSTGQSVVIDDVTNEVIHVGGPGFKYGPGSGDVR
jgi:RHS repeat-associated protein